LNLLNLNAMVVKTETSGWNRTNGWQRKLNSMTKNLTV